MPFFLVTYDGPTATDEIQLMTAIQSLGMSFDICYKTYLLKTDLHGYQLGEWIQKHLESSGSPLGSNDRLVIAQVDPTNLSTFAWHGPFKDQLSWLLAPHKPSPPIRKM